MRPVLFALAALLAVGLAHADASVTGKYRLRLSDDAARVARLSGQTAENQLTLRVNGRFLLETGGSVRHGDYRVEDGRLILRAEDGQTLRGDLQDGRVTLEGLEFEHIATGEDSGQVARRFPTDASTGRLNSREREVQVPVLRSAPVLVAAPPVVAPPLVVIEPASPVVFAVVKPVPVYRLKADDCCGVWTVRRDGFEEKGQRMELKKDGTFRFAMQGATSEGTWTVEQDQIVLVYTKVDGQPLEEGASGRKTIPLASDASAFQIDTFRYERATDK